MNGNDIIVIFQNWFWVFGFVSVVLLYLKTWHKRPDNFPPGPRGVPLLGCYSLFGKKIGEEAFKLSQNYGPIMSIRMGTQDSVFLNDFDSIHKALVKNGSCFSGRNKFESLEEVKKGFGLAFSDYCESWKSQRKFGLMTLRGFGVGKKGMEKICLEEAYHLNEKIQSKNGEPFDPSDFLHKAVSNNICNIAFGKRYDYDDKLFNNMLGVVKDRFDDPKTNITDLMLTIVPSSKHVPPFSNILKKSNDRLREMFAWLEEIIDEHEETYDEENIRDFIDAFLQEKKKGNNPTFTNFQLVNYIFELFLAGTDTTSSALLWGLLCLLHYPEAQKKLRKEILSMFGSSGNISMLKKPEMHYTNAFIQELMRFRTFGPLAIPHKTSEDVQFEGFFIPKGTMIMPNLWAVHNDPKLWENPDIFKPERFLDQKGSFVKSNYVIPFSVGPRFCLGEQLAKMEVFVLFASMVQKFEFLPDPNKDGLPSIVDGTSGFSYIPAHYNIVAKEL